MQAGSRAEAVEHEPDATRPGLRAQEAQRIALFAPVFLGGGVWAYFATPVEPTATAVAAVALAALLALAVALAGRRVRFLRIGALAVTALGVGYALAGARAHSVAQPVLSAAAQARTLEVSGTVIAVDRSSRGRARLLIERPAITGLAPSETPYRVRVTAPEPPDDSIRALLWRDIHVSARLSPPFGPVEPGSHDPRFDAWFDQLGAIGVSRGAVTDLGRAERPTVRDAARARLAELRAAVSLKAREALDGEAGALAAALLVGDRSALPETLVESLRGANLSHLLAISGLHMGLVCLTIFGALRLLFAVSENAGGRLEPKKLAAIGAIAAGVIYLALSGGAIASWRAFAMAAVAFGAILVDRPPVTLRAVALAAMLILCFSPESLFNIGFQLSFAATTAMVATFEWSRPVWRARRSAAEGGGLWLGRLVGLWALALVVSSLVAGLATAPFAAAAFNRSASYGLLANVLAMPIMGFWIMPFGVASLVLAPFGLEALALVPMGWGLEQVISIAAWVSSLPGAVRLVPVPAPEVLPLLTLGGLWLLLWRTRRLRLLGLVPIAASLLLWHARAPRPDLVIGPGGRLLGLSGPDGRALDRAKGEGFVAERWLRADGDPASQAEAADRGAWQDARGGHEAALGALNIRVVFWKTLRARDAEALCAGPTLVIAPRARSDSDAEGYSLRDHFAQRDQFALQTGLRGRSAADAVAGSEGSRAQAHASSLAQGWARDVGWLGPGAVGALAALSPLTFVTDPSEPDCLLLDAPMLAETGALSVSRHADGLRITSVARVSGRRFWTDATVRAAGQ